MILRVSIVFVIILEHKYFSLGESRFLKKHKTWFDKGHSKLLEKRASQIALVTGSEPNKWRQSEE
jgi:hypothetical protein